MAYPSYVNETYRPLQEPLTAEQLRGLAFTKALNANDVTEIENMFGVDGDYTPTKIAYWAVLFSKPDILELCLREGVDVNEMYGVPLNISQDLIGCGLENRENRLKCREILRDYLASMRTKEES